MAVFMLTFETITPESAEHGEAADSGVLYEAMSLREAVETMASADYIEANEWPVQCPHWVTGYTTHENYRTGERQNLTLCFPKHLTASTRRRIVRLLGGNC